jgi:hypothetical protein
MGPEPVQEQGGVFDIRREDSAKEIWFALIH